MSYLRITTSGRPLPALGLGPSSYEIVVDGAWSPTADDQIAIELGELRVEPIAYGDMTRSERERADKARRRVDQAAAEPMDWELGSATEDDRG